MRVPVSVSEPDRDPPGGLALAMILASAAAPAGARDKVDVVVLHNGDRITGVTTDSRFWTSLGYSF